MSEDTKNESGESQDQKMIKLKCDDDDSKSLEADQMILAKHSKYFEGSVSFSDPELVFDSEIVSFEALEMLVKFLETGELCKPTLIDLEELILAADYLQIDSAMTLLVQYLHEDVKTRMSAMGKITKKQLVLYLRIYRNIRRYEINHNYQHQKISLRYTQYYAGEVYVCICFVLQHHFKRIMNEAQILNLERDRIYELLSSEQLRISEEDVLRTIKMWVNHDLEKRKKHFLGLLGCMRPDPSLSSTVIIEELLCNCRNRTSCSCLTSTDFMVAYLAHKEKNQIKMEGGPATWTARPRHEYE